MASAFNLVFSPSIITEHVIALPTFLSDVVKLASSLKDTLNVFSVESKDGVIVVSVMNQWASNVIASCGTKGKLKYIILDNTMGNMDNGIEPCDVENDERPKALFESIHVEDTTLQSPREAGCRHLKGAKGPPLEPRAGIVGE